MKTRRSDSDRPAGSWSYTHAELSQDSPGLLDGGADAFEGDRLSGAPRHQGGVLATYAMLLGDDTALELQSSRPRRATQSSPRPTPDRVSSTRCFARSSGTLPILTPSRVSHACPNSTSRSTTRFTKYRGLVRRRGLPYPSSGCASIACDGDEYNTRRCSTTRT